MALQSLNEVDPTLNFDCVNLTKKARSKDVVGPGFPKPAKSINCVRQVVASTKPKQDKQMLLLALGDM